MNPGMKKGSFSPKRALAALGAILLLSAGAAWGANAVPPVALVPLNQLAVPEPPSLFEYVRNKAAAIRLGKALFWDMQVGSDGVTACATCHFSAGTDNRVKNTLNPGDGIFDVRSPNQTLLASDFPFHKRNAPADFKASTVQDDKNDVVGSQGVRLKQFVSLVPGQAEEIGGLLDDPIFNLNGSNIRQVTGRNTPSVINSVFNFTNFWDGRASAFFNGSSPFGPLDQSAGIWVESNGSLVKQPVLLDFASLASQATGPPLSDVEMSFRGRTFPHLGRKLLGLTPLDKQLVHPDDSELGNLSRASLLPDGSAAGTKGLNTSYPQMIRDAFQTYLWNSGLQTQGGFTQMEANFSLFWGLAIQLYEATLISDDTPFDRFLGGNSTALTPQQQDGFNLFFGAGRCDVCHGATELTNASVRASRYITDADHGLLELMPVASGQQIIYDNGFNNTAVRPTTEDVCRAALSPFDNPLTGTKFPLSFSDLAELQAQNKLPFSTPVLIAGLPSTFPVANGGAFKVPGLRNIELTAPYMHNGSMMTLEDVVDFYARGGNFPTANKANLDINIVELPALQGEPAAKAALVAFMKSMTDERVRRKEAPFDHPEIFIPNGDSAGDSDMIHLQATGMFGSTEPVSLTVSPSLASPQATGTDILFTATGSGGSGAYEYQFWLKDTSGTYTLVQPFSASGTWNWLTATAQSGTYTVAVQVRDASGTVSPTGFDAEVVHDFILAQAGVTPITSMTIDTAPASPQLAGTQVTFTATGVVGGNANSRFQFWVKDTNGVYSLAQPYSTSSQFNWNTTGLPPGTYAIAIQAKNGDSALGYDLELVESYTIQSGEPLPPQATTLDMLTSPASPQLAGAPVSFTATAGGGSGTYHYQFWLKDINGVYTMVQPYSAANVFNWNTAGLPPGVYYVATQAKSVGSASGYDIERIDSYTILPPPASSLSVLTSLSSPRPAGTQILVSAVADGGSGTYEYQFWLKDTTGTYTQVQPYSAANIYDWNTTSLTAGTYTFAVQARSLGSISPNGFDVESTVNFEVQ